MRASSVSVNEGETPGAILEAMQRADVEELPVVAGDGAFRGMVEVRAVERRLYGRRDVEAPASAIAEEAVAHATSEEPIEDAADAMLTAELEVLPVLTADGRLEGLLVLDDLRQVPQLLAAVSERRRQRALAAGADTARVTLLCGLVSAGLALVLFAMWVEGPTYGLPPWVSWANAVAALLASVGAVAAPSSNLISVPLWSIAGVGLISTAGIAHGFNEGPAATWVQAGFGVVFLLLVLVLGLAMPRRRHARLRLASQTS